MATTIICDNRNDPVVRSADEALAKRFREIYGVMGEPTDEEMVLHPLSEIQELDELVHLLGIEDSAQTPCERVRELFAEIESLRIQRNSLLVT